ELFVSAVESLVVLGMPMPTIGLALDQRRAFSASSTRQCSLRRLIDGKHIIAVDSHTVETVAVRPVCHIVNRHALFNRDRVRVLIVLTDKNDRQTLNARKVQRLVKVACVARTFAEVRDDDVVGLLQLEGVSNAGSDWQIGSEHARIPEDTQLGHPAVKRRVAAFRQARNLAEHLRHHHAWFYALHEKRSEISMEGADVVLLAEPETGPDDNRFLTDTCIHAAAHLALTDEDAKSFVEGPNEPQPIEHLQKLFWRQFELRSLDWRHGAGTSSATG